MVTGKEVFGRFEYDLDDRDVEIIRHLFSYQDDHGTGITFNKFERLMKKHSRVSRAYMAHQTLLNHIEKLIEKGLVEKKRDEKSRLHYKPTFLSLTDTIWKSLRQLQSSKLQELVEGLRKIDMEGYDIAEVTENIINVLILSLGRLFKRCILTDDPLMRTILFNVTYDLIRKIFEYAISNAESDERIKRKILEAIESTFKPYAEKYEIEL